MPHTPAHTQSLLHDPNPNSPANNEAAQLYRENRREYEKKVGLIVSSSWDEENQCLSATDVPLSGGVTDASVALSRNAEANAADLEMETAGRDEQSNDPASGQPEQTVSRPCEETTSNPEPAAKKCATSKTQTDKQ